MPDALSLVPNDDDVVLRYPHSDHVVSAQIARGTILEIVDRQKSGKFHFYEVVTILACESDESRTIILQAANDAFNSGNLRFFTQAGTPVNPSGRVLPLSYGEYTTPDDVNQWQKEWGAKYRFRYSATTPSSDVDTCHDWTLQAREIASDFIKSWRGTGKPSMSGVVAPHVANELKNKGVIGRGSKARSKDTIYRHALQGWKPD